MNLLSLPGLSCLIFKIQPRDKQTCRQTDRPMGIAINAVSQRPNCNGERTQVRISPRAIVLIFTKARSTLATMSKQHCRSTVRLCRKEEISTQNSFNIVAVFGNKVERCFDIVAGVDRPLRYDFRHCDMQPSPHGLYTLAAVLMRLSLPPSVGR